MANDAAFTLREAYDAETFAGSVAVGDKTLDVAARLEEGGGTILTDDQSEIRALDGYPALKRTPVSAAREGQSQSAEAEQTDSLDAMSKDELLDLADEHSVEGVDASSSKGDLVAALRAEDLGE